MIHPARDRLLDAGQRLFGAQGYAATSMRQVAENAKLSIGNIYNHFLSKEDIFQTILLERNPFITAGLPNLPANFQRQHANTLLEKLAEQPEFFNLILIELLEFRGSHLPALFEKNFASPLPPTSWRILVSLLVSYHVTQNLLSGAFPPAEQPQQASPHAWLDCVLTGILNLE